MVTNREAKSWRSEIGTAITPNTPNVALLWMSTVCPQQHSKGKSLRVRSTTSVSLHLTGLSSTGVSRNLKSLQKRMDILLSSTSNCDENDHHGRKKLENNKPLIKDKKSYFNVAVQKQRNDQCAKKLKSQKTYTVCTTRKLRSCLTSLFSK